MDQATFMAVAYPRAKAAALRAFKKWHPRKRDDAIQEMLGKVWATWVLNAQKGKDPLALLPANIHWAIWWVRYDRRIAGRNGIDVMDYRAGLKRQMLSGQGRAIPTDRSDPGNGWIDWGLSEDDDPAEWVEALETAGMTTDDLV